MEITIQRLKEEAPFHLRATNESGNTADLDGALHLGGTNQGMRPMELLLSSVGSCTTMDIIHLLRKQRQELRDIKASLKGDRPDTHPMVFTHIHLHFDLYGDINPKKAERAVSLAVEKYCPALRMVEKVASITYDFEIHP